MALSCGPVQRVSPGTLTALHAPGLTAWAIRGEREAHLQLAIRAAGAAGARRVCGLCREVLDGARARRSAARGHRHAHRVSVQLELEDDGRRKSIPPSRSSPKATGCRSSCAGALAAAVAGRQRASSTGLSPSTGVAGESGLVAGVEALAGRPRSATPVRGHDVGETRHPCWGGAQANSSSTSAENEGLDNHVGPLARKFLQSRPRARAAG
jgi:hypothetical protein